MLPRTAPPMARSSSAIGSWSGSSTQGLVGVLGPAAFPQRVWAEDRLLRSQRLQFGTALAVQLNLDEMRDVGMAGSHVHQVSLMPQGCGRAGAGTHLPRGNLDQLVQ